MGLLHCPDCKNEQLYPASLENVGIDACNNCGGLWFDKNELKKVIAAQCPEHLPDTPVIESLGSCKGESKKLCPSCNVRFKTHKLCTDSEIEIEVCNECLGIWLEKGELDHVRALQRLPAARKSINRKRTWGDWLFQFFLSLPIEFNVKARKFPVITISLIVMNIIMMVVLLIQDSPMAFVEKMALNPSTQKIFTWFLTLFSYQFLHSSIIHLIGNMYFLYILGDNLEDVLGRPYYLLFYLGCGLVAGVAETLFSSTGRAVVGSSGSIAGIMAAYAFIFRKAKLTFMFLFWQKKLSAAWYFVIWIVFNIIGALSGSFNVAWYAHFGGFAAGLIITLLIYDHILKNNPILKYLNSSRDIDIKNA